MVPGTIIAAIGTAATAYKVAKTVGSLCTHAWNYMQKPGVSSAVSKNASAFASNSQLSKAVAQYVSFDPAKVAALMSTNARPGLLAHPTMPLSTRPSFVPR